MKIRSPFEGLRIEPELVCTFFATFARFEFTLKEAGFTREEGEFAQPAWRRFGSEAAQWLDVSPGSSLETAITHLCTNPPQVQMQSGWEPKTLHGDTATARAIDAARRVRNNLFHGGKHTPHSPDGRDQQLVESALTVLMACLEQSEKMRWIFEQTEF